MVIHKTILLSNGFIHPGFRHAKGDIEYSYRLIRQGLTPFVFNEIIGVCPRFDQRETPYDQSLNFLKAFNILIGVKWHPVKETLLFYRLANRILWPFLFPVPYVIWFVKFAYEKVKNLYSKRV